MMDCGNDRFGQTILYPMIIAHIAGEVKYAGNEAGALLPFDLGECLLV